MVANLPTSTQSIEAIYQKQAAFFATGKTLNIAFRKEMLRKFMAALEKYTDALLEAEYKDLRKDAFDAFGFEIGLVLSETRNMLRNVDKWSRRRRVATPLFHAISSSYIYKDPYGKVLIMAPWNYPILLLFEPMVAALAAGNTVVLKPSELTPNTSSIMTKLIREVFSEEYVAIFEGGPEVAQSLLTYKWDYLFFTGGTEIGRIIYQAAAKHLTPVTLELGGKSPCIVDKELHFDFATKRILWGKLANCGQTCVAPDYILVHKDLKDKFIARLKELVTEFYGENPQQHPQYARIVNRRHFDRITRLMEPDRIIFGGKTDAADLYISPTLMEVSDWNCPIMQEEIFGPVLPILTYSTLEEAIQLIKVQSKPLALYMFSTNNDNIKKVMENVSFGGGCINETLWHLGNPHLPFNGVGDSGIGGYHGKYSFDTFSHEKSVLRRSNLLDIWFRYPGKKLSLAVVKFLERWAL